MGLSSPSSTGSTITEASLEHRAAPVASVVISTRNRKDDLCKAIESVLRQTVSVEILVMDDASEDGTAELVAEKFPRVRVVRSEGRVGLIVQRNRAAKIARGTYIFSLDDDAVLIEPDTIERVLTQFDHPRVGAVAMPIVNLTGGGRVPLGARAPGDPGIWITSAYKGGAHAVRRDLFLALGGYRDVLFQWGEEENFCLKLYANGYVVRLANCGITEHHLNPVGRHKRGKNVWIYRNSILNAWFYAPWFILPAICIAESGRWLFYGIKKPRELPVIIEGLARGYYRAMTLPSSRNPVTCRLYVFYLWLRAAKVLRLSAIESRLPGVAPALNATGQ